MNKREVRIAFRNACFERDGYSCAMCKWKPSVWNEAKPSLDAHHITDRMLMPFGGYVKENGISLCPQCHLLAEMYHSLGQSYFGYSPDDLYGRIKSNYDLAVECSLIELGGCDARAIHDYHSLVFQVQGGEAVIAFELNTPINLATWELSCEAQSISDPLILLYGKGRYYGN